MVFVPSVPGSGQAAAVRAGLPRLSADQCRTLIEHATGGHLALSQGALPMVLPVTCRSVGDSLLVRAASTVLGRAPAQPGIVAFATAGSSADGRWRWEVVVQGRAEVGAASASGRADLSGLLEPPELSLLGGELTTVLRISMELVAGWQFGDPALLQDQIEEPVR